jgi:MFS transporter, AAHS family, 4-hydroxybenzoate transporter
MRQERIGRHESTLPSPYSMVEQPTTINVIETIDAAKLSAYQIAIVALCFLILAADGFDAGAIGYISPSLVAQWGISRAALGPIMSASLIGLGFGALVAGPIGDKVGRKAVLVASVGTFGLFTLLAAQANSVAALTILRLLTGIGLGAAMPNALTLTSEYSPVRARSVSVCIMNCGYGAGLVLGGIVSGWLIPEFGWRIVLAIGGVAPVALAVALIFFLPESIEFLASRKDQDIRIAKILARIVPRLNTSNARFIVPVDNALRLRKAPLTQLFTRQHRLGTLMLWLAYFMGLMIYYLLVNWLPTLMKDNGFSAKSASWITSAFPLGGVVGTICVGWLMDHFNGARVISATFGLTAALVILVGSMSGYSNAIGTLLFACGALLISAPTAMSALAVMFYPTPCRATGVSWMHGIGRLGGVAGATVGALLLSTGWSLGPIFGLLAIPAIVAACAIYILAASKRRLDTLLDTPLNRSSGA